MSVRKFCLPNKPLTMISEGQIIYIGDAHGFVYEIPYPFIAPRILFQALGPVSALVFCTKLYYGSWDGDVGIFGEKKINLGVHMVKSMAIHRDLIYVSMGLCIYVLDLCLDLKCSYEVEHKVLSMTIFKEVLYCGMGVPFIAQIDDTLTTLGRSLHDTSILCMSGEYTGSADGRILKQNYLDINKSEQVYKGQGWIRSMYNEHLFSDGRNVIADLCALKNKKNEGNAVIYSHDSDVVGVIMVGSKIISIGLDYSYCVFDTEPTMTPEEEKELADLMDE